MSLKITSPITTPEGFVVENAYGRVSVTDDITGKYLNSQVVLYVSELDYVDQKYPLNININTFSTSEYDRGVDGTDILLIAHQKLQETLLAQGISSIIVLGN